MEKKVRYYDPRTGRSGELILLELPEIPEKLSELENDEGFSKRLSELTNDAGFVTAAQPAAAAPVQSVNGATGAVTRSQLGCLSVDGDAPAVWVGSSYDLNNFFSGVVLCYSNVQHVPSADWWHVMASGTSGTVVQIAAKLQNNGQMMTRRCAGGTWSAWEPVTGWLPTSGGTMSGSIKFPNGTAMPHKSSPQFVITIDSFANGGEMGYATLSELSGQLISYVNDVTVVSKSSKVTFVKKYYCQYGRVGQLTIGFHVTTALTNGETMATLSGIGRPWFGPTVFARAASGGKFLSIDSGYSGNNVTLKCAGAGPVDNWYSATFTYITV